MFYRIRTWKWIISALACFLLLDMLPASFVEKHYSTGFFLSVRKLLDNSFGKIPFPSYYIFLGVLFLIMLKWMLHFFREKPEPVLMRLFKVISFAGFLVTLFFILWGFNYGRIPLEERLNLHVKPLTQEQLMQELSNTSTHLARIRGMIKKDTATIPQIVFINNVEDNSREALNHTLADLHYPYSSKIRGRIVFEDMFLVFSIGGQYLPFVGEGNVDDAVYYSKKPFYLMHEMAHGNGFTEEAACNFLAYVSCVSSNNLSLQYSGELNYLVYLLAELRYRDKEGYERFQTSMPLALRKDLEAMNRYYEEHTFKTGFIGDMVNNVYLKLLGVKDGVKNYDKMVLLIYAWREKG